MVVNTKTLTEENVPSSQGSRTRFCSICGEPHCSIFIEGRMLCRFTGELKNDARNPNDNWDNSLETPFYCAKRQDITLYKSFIEDLELLRPDLDKEQRMNFAKRSLLSVNTRDEKFDSRENRLHQARFLVDLMSSRYSTPEKLKKKILALYEKIMDDSYCVKKHKHIIFVSIYYIVYKNKGQGLNLRKLLSDFGIKQKTVNSFVRAFKRQHHIRMPVTDLAVFIRQVCAELKFDPKFGDKAVALYDELRDKGYVFFGKKPNAIVAALIYMVSISGDNNDMSQEYISSKLGIASVSMRSRYKEILKLLGDAPLRDENDEDD
jgi:transcription initiation factor TFIIIB Brf1 subunit/transcription initiation factor TFIIB